MRNAATFAKESQSWPWVFFLNFPPVSNLKNVSKLIEKAVAAQLNDYLVYNDLHGPVQSANKPCHSTETALTKVHNDPW